MCFAFVVSRLNPNMGVEGYEAYVGAEGAAHQRGGVGGD